MLPIRQEKHYKEGGVATLSVYDRRGVASGNAVPGRDAPVHAGNAQAPGPRLTKLCCGSVLV